MDNITQLSDALQHLLTDQADLLARQSGFIKRQVKFSGASFAQTTILGWWEHPDATLEQLCDTADLLGCQVSSQALEQRFTQECADFLKQVLDCALSTVLAAEAVAVELLSRFHGVYLLDSTTIKLPPEFAAQWPGGANQYSDCAAGVKLEVLLELCRGELRGQLHPAREHDSNNEFNTATLPPGSLRIADLGYYSSKLFAHLDERGVYWLSRWKAGTVLYRHRRRRLDLQTLLSSWPEDELEMNVLVGREQAAARLLAVRVPAQVAAQRRERERIEAKQRGQRPSAVRLALADWEISLTNIGAQLLSLSEARVLYRLRWQIELLFKLWKGQGKVDESRSQKQWRVISEVFAKLTAMVIQHWVLLMSSWEVEERSWWKAALIVRQQVNRLVSHWGQLAAELAAVVAVIGRRVERHGKVNKRRNRPAAHQLLTTTSHCIP